MRRGAYLDHALHRRLWTPAVRPASWGPAAPACRESLAKQQNLKTGRDDVRPCAHVPRTREDLLRLDRVSHEEEARPGPT